MRDARLHGTEAYLWNAGPPGDIFNVGMLVYLMVRCDAPCHDAVVQTLKGEPFEGSSHRKRREVAEACAKALDAIVWTGHPWDQLPLCRDLCRLLINVKPGPRGIDAGDVLHVSPWFRKKSMVVTKEAADALEDIAKAMGLRLPEFEREDDGMDASKSEREAEATAATSSITEAAVQDVRRGDVFMMSTSPVQSKRGNTAGTNTAGTAGAAPQSARNQSMIIGR